MNLTKPGRPVRSVEQQSTPNVSALDKMHVAFKGQHSREEIKRKLDRVMHQYGLELTEDEYKRCGNVLVVLSDKYGPTEMEILDYMDRSFVPGLTLISRRWLHLRSQCYRAEPINKSVQYAPRLFWLRLQPCAKPND
jgi:hypothetical protein